MGYRVRREMNIKEKRRQGLNCLCTLLSSIYFLFSFSAMGASLNEKSSYDNNADIQFSQHPPLSKFRASANLVLIAHWYNDFGLASTKLADGKLGALTWYDWSWAREKNSSGYDSSRHPLLGWYKGDDPVVLDWQCYWLKENGIGAINIVGDGIDINKWRSESDKHHWIYELFNNAPNCKELQYILWMKNGTRDKSIKSLHAAWLSVLEKIHARYRNFFYISKDGKVFPVVYLFEGEGLRGNLDKYRGEEKSRDFLLSIAAQYRKRGFGGIAIFARHPTSTFIGDANLARGGVLYYGAGYSEVDGVRGARIYEDYVKNYAAPREGVIPNVVTSHESKPPHPSKWTQAGSTPKLFCALLLKAAESAPEVEGKKIVEIYNVAEWAEGGAGLQPNLRDGFGYLQATRRVAITAGQRLSERVVCKFNN